MRRLLLSSLVVTAFAGACTPPDPTMFCAGGSGTCAVVSTASSGGGSLGSVGLDGAMSRLGLDTVDAHVYMRVHEGELYVLQQDSGTVRIYDPKTLTVKIEHALGDATHPSAMTQPRDFWVDDDRGKIWVTLAGNEAAACLAVVDRGSGAIVYAGMPQAADDPDGKPEPQNIHQCDAKLYVTLKGSYTDGSVTKYVQGRMGITDPDKHTVRGVMPLAGKNPVAFTTVEGDCNQGIVATAGDNDTLDGLGTVERFDLNKGFSRGVVVIDQQLMGHPYLMAINANRAYLAVSTASSGFTMDKVVAVDWNAKTILGDVTPELDGIVGVSAFNSHVYVGASSGVYVANDDATMVGAATDAGGVPLAMVLP